jgi:integrase
MALVKTRKWTTKQGENREAWIVDYTDQHGKRRLKTFARKKEADAFLVQARHEVKLGTHTPASTSKTLEETWRLWIEDSEANGLERSTLRQRQQHIVHHVGPFLGGLKLSDLSAPVVYQFDSDLREAGRSLQMRKKVLMNLKTCISFAQNRGLVAQNAARGVRIKGGEREAATGPLRPGVDFPTMAELNTLIDNATGRFRPFIVTAIFTGMRLSELRGLRWADVDLDAGVIHVRQRANAWGTMGPPKSRAGKRDIPLAPIVINTLRAWRAQGIISDLVFPSRGGRPQPMSNIRRRHWEPLLAKCGLKYRFHVLRHAAASLFIAHLRWQPKRIQTVMGHASVSMTYDLYGHLFEDRAADRADMARLEAAMRVA